MRGGATKAWHAKRSRGIPLPVARRPTVFSIWLRSVQTQNETE